MFTIYEKGYILGRDAHCLCCGEVKNECGETLYKGQVVTRICTPKSKKFAHEKCLKKMWKEGTAYELTEGCNYNSQLDNHDLVIVAPKEETPYFAECGMKVLPHNAQLRKFVFSNESCGYRDGHIVSAVFKKSKYKVFVNGHEVHSHDEYRRILGK